ncbi:AAA family ATPase peroxin 6 NDAI_0G01370 [Naumovozyma dairenensis CBS 421]|uniref:Peroxisomal ATPase PEX6 n=1 Tax=Naumovozyma dairenensis (strain ATCC 10597 / BCRC 20456 / CBS 421 / NBRC 0211 / NRRL Y-12639) TaxID=1071378 RepID=G0WDQ2_NAUDC|nr:hypothetical protein NDAI_0G01370 [Naumovozyma dairenensis CBS 421]CCD25913.2 hypothetical protein NDAI_0G01370 [Naumovozyma dairenensis CBS 421]
MLQASLLFDFTNQCGQCEVSGDVFHEWSKQNISTMQTYASIELPSYTYETKRFVVYCTLNESLNRNTIKIPAKLARVFTKTPAIESCSFVHHHDLQPPTLETVSILLKSTLYAKLMKLNSSREKLEFLRLKYHIEDMKTVIHSHDILDYSLCEVLTCSPFSQGVIDFNETQIIFVSSSDKKNNQLCATPNNIPIKALSLSKSQNTNLIVKLQCLMKSIPRELMIPTPSSTDDDSLFAFTDVQTFINLNITSGSFVKLSQIVGNNYQENATSCIVRLFLLLEPNDFKTNRIIYISPRICSNFPNDNTIKITPYDSFNINKVPVATKVSISRVGSWNNSQKLYQNIIFNNLKIFFLSKKRILQIGDLLPITFDSNFALLLNDTNDDDHDDDDDGDDGADIDNDDQQEVDSLVWFRIENVEFQDYKPDSTNAKVQFVIDPLQTKLSTSKFIKYPKLPLSKYEYKRFFNLPSIFPYDQGSIFPYAKQLSDILESSLFYAEKDIPMNISILLYSNHPNVGKKTLVKHTADWLGFHLLEIDCSSLPLNNGSLDSTNKILGSIRAKIENVLSYTTSTIITLSNLEYILSKTDPNQDPESTKLSQTMDLGINEIINHFTTNFKGVVFIIIMNNIDILPQNIRTKLKFEYLIPVPNEDQRLAIFQWYLTQEQLNNQKNKNSYKFKLSNNVNVSNLALHSASLTPLAIKSIVQTAKYKALKDRQEEENTDTGMIMWDNNYIFITMEHLQYAMDQAREGFSMSIGAPKIPKVTWDDIGGVELIKDEIMDTIDMPLRHPELFATGMKKRSGILFYGPPGTGKTLMAKAIASNFSLNFFSVKGPELLNMYIGESEANVRKVFQRARDAKPCVIFFDEIDSVAPKRGNQGDSGGVMDRIVSQLLAELDGMSTGDDGIFIIGATNRPDLLDEALLRPGRFDKLLYLGVPDTNEKQLNILKALTRKFTLHENVKLPILADKCPFNYTGADFYALCSDSMLNAMTRIASEIDEKVETYNKENGKGISIRYWFDNVATEEDTNVIVNMEDFIKAIKELKPSVSQDELDHYLSIKQNFEGASPSPSY